MLKVSSPAGRLGTLPDMDKMDGDKVREYVDYMLQRLDNMDEQAETLHKHAPAMFSRQDAEVQDCAPPAMQLLSWAQPELSVSSATGAAAEHAAVVDGLTVRIKLLVPQELRDARDYQRRQSPPIVLI